MPKLNLPRDIIAQIAQGNRQAIPALEQVFSMLSDGGLPSTIEEANALAGAALTAAQSALASLAALTEALSAIETAPAPTPHVDADDFRPASVPQVEQDDMAPRAHLGTIAAQNADQVDITGGAIDGTTIGATAAAAANFTTLAASGQITSTVATGTAPLIIASTTRVARLNVERAGVADSAGAADSLTNPTTYPADATDLPTVITLANALKAAAQSKGL